MSERRTRTSLFLYVPVAILGMFIIYFLFAENFKSGMEAGKNAPPPTEPRVKAGAEVDQRALAQDASLAPKGKTLYQINCASCHGATGEGDGPRAAGLNPPARNYKTQEFKYGNDVVSIHNTLMKGSPGTSMPSFQLLPQEDIWAMVHYVRTMIPNPTPTTDEIIAQLPESPTGGGASSAPATATTADTASAGGQRIPILFAMERLAEPPSELEPAAPMESSTPGAKLFSRHCASCHGVAGEGKQVDLISVAPYHYERTKPLMDKNAKWYASRDDFASLVTQGLPGRVMPGSGTLTKTQIDQLYEFVKELAE